MAKFNHRPALKSALLVCFLLLPFLFGACGSSQSASNKIELVFWTMQLADFKGTIQPMLDTFEKQHPGVRVKWVDVPGNEIEKRTLTAVLSPNVPDVVNLNPDFSATLATRNSLMDMAKVLPEQVRESYLPVAWQAATLETPSQKLTFGLPWYITSKVTLYNKALLKQAGYTAPPSDFSGLADFSENMRSKTKQYALMPILTQSGNFLKELNKINVPLYDPATGKAAFASPTAIAHLKLYIDLYRHGMIPAEALTEDHRAAVDRYQSGSLAMLLVGPNFLKIVQENAPAIYKETAVAPQFPADSPFVDFSEMVLVVPARSRHPKEAVALAQFVTNAENQLKLAQAAPVLPSVTAALQNPYFQTANEKDTMAQGRGISASQLLAAKKAYQIRPRQGEINEVVNYYVQLAMLGKLSPEAALHKAQERVNALL